MDEAAARTRIEQLVDALTAPVLSVEEIDLLLDRARKPDRSGNGSTNRAGAASTWAASTVITVGTVVRIASTPARYWRCVSGGVTAAVQPSWPVLGVCNDYGRTDANYPASWQPQSRQLVDGTVVWEDAGGEWAPTWDFDVAAYEGWRLKSGKLVGAFDFGEDMQTFTRSQMFAHCRAMADSFRRGGATTLNV
ncbi:MAG: hypothetical protein ABIP21_00245 [Acidimicrobiia bacterium]